ncbi:MAG TPA: c-type cytochrome domain-containing protein [Steroidobacteraceae bacterium]|nr:c-type cytochrome domain-containing protein [Steroidobacteraceae bacterium]
MRPQILATCSLAVIALMTAACASKQQATVSYSADVAPLLEKYCQACHMPGQLGYQASGFDLQGYESLMQGTKYGPVVLPGDPLTSALVMLIEGRADPSIKMPHAGAPQMTKQEIEIIRRWVEQGAKNN